jgi:hypothetical protein
MLLNRLNIRVSPTDGWLKALFSQML